METRSNILVVDDNPDKLMLLEAALKLAGYHVNTATDGEEALAVVASFTPDLIITDVMPQAEIFGPNRDCCCAILSLH